MITNQTNWAGNYQYTATHLHHPQTIEELQELIGRSPQLKILGSRHSFNAIADTPGDLISLDHLPQTIQLDPDRRTVTVTAATRYGQLAHYLHQHGYALPNLASLPHISIAGACATATHGSGDANGNLATAVSALALITATGEQLTLSPEQHGEQFQGMVVHLGGLGVVTHLTLNVVPTFDLCQDVYENLPHTQLEEHFEDILSAAYSVSLFTDWQGTAVNQVWIKRHATAAPFQPTPSWFAATPAAAQRHPLATMPAENCTEQMGVPGPWHERLPHFRMAFTPSSGEELQSEYFVPRHHAVAAFRAIQQLGDHITPILHISEIRTIAADTLWLSPSYQQPSVAFHFTWKQDWPAVRRLLPRLEAQLAPFHPRPHWGKLFTISATHLHSLYPRLPDFQQLLHHYDPTAKFRNPFLDAYIFGQDS
jgi:xylitol oxidase